MYYKTSRLGLKKTIKYLILSSIIITTFFSSIGLTNATNRGTIDEVLNIKFGVEQIEYKLSELPKRHFNNYKLQERYNFFRYINQKLTNSFYKKYKAGNIDYYTTKGIIKNHQNFIYNTSKLFDYFELKLENPNYIDINDEIINSYSQIRISYNRIIFLYKRSKK